MTKVVKFGTSGWPLPLITDCSVITPKTPLVDQ